MGFSTEILVALIGAATSAIAGLFAGYWRRVEARKFEIEREALKRTTAKIGVDLGFVSFEQQFEKKGTALPQELLKQIEDKVELRLRGFPHTSDEKIKGEISKELEMFKKRIEKIEQRFPDETQIDKVASINDALLSQRIDQLKERIDKMEENIPSKWDIALTVSAILGGICAVVAATYGVIQFVTQAHSK